MEFYNKYFEKQKVKAEAKEKDLRIHWWAIGIIATGILGYFLNFAVRPFLTCKSAGSAECEWHWISSATGTWGEFGDFVGGTINPFIGLLTVVLLVRSIKLTINALRQNEEALKVSKDELIETRRAVEQATAAQEKMEQSLKEQLEEARSQNNFANYYKHLEEFTKYVFECYPATGNQKIDPRKLHGILYPSRKISEEMRKYSIQNKRDLNSNIKRLSIAMISLIESDCKEVEAFCSEIQPIFVEHNSRFRGAIVHTDEELGDIKVNGVSYFAANGSIGGAIRFLVKDCMIVDKLLDFDPDVSCYLPPLQLLLALYPVAKKIPTIVKYHEELKIHAETKIFAQQLDELKAIVKRVEDFEKDYSLLSRGRPHNSI